MSRDNFETTGDESGEKGGENRRGQKKKKKKKKNSASELLDIFPIWLSFLPFSPLRSMVQSQAWPFKWNLFFSLVVVLHAIFVWYVFLAIESMGKILWSDYSHSVYGFQYFWNFLHSFNSEEGTGANAPSCPRDHILCKLCRCPISARTLFCCRFQNSHIQSCKHLALHKGKRLSHFWSLLLWRKHTETQKNECKHREQQRFMQRSIFGD